MSTLFDDDRFTWRETFFILLEPQYRPRQSELQALLQTVPGRVRLLDASTTSNGLMGTITVMSLDDHSALEMRYSQDPAIADEMKSLAKTLLPEATYHEKVLLKKVTHLPAKIEIQHFEQTAGSGMFILDRTMMYPQTGADPQKDKRTKSSHPRRPKFYFDLNCYDNCRFPGKEDHSLAVNLLDADDEAPRRTESDFMPDTERINPGMLVFLLEKVKRLTHGIAIDPAGGLIW